MKRLVLTGLKRLELQDSQAPEPGQGEVVLQVECAAVCRTDAKMWEQGHRDLILPRVLGHELIVRDAATGQRFAVWPGNCCGVCRFCREGRENLCDSMRITGFHRDGGFAEQVQVRQSCLVPLPGALDPVIGCFAEPVGCVLNALEPLELKNGETLIVFGGGVVGLLAALAGREMGARPLVIETSQTKIERIRPFLEHTGIDCVKETRVSEADAVLNACPDPAAFSQAVAKVRKGGRLSFFSGLTKNKTLETNLINLLHYREVALTGSYGLTLRNMIKAVEFLSRNKGSIRYLVEKVLSPEKAAGVLPDILSGRSLKAVIDFRVAAPDNGAYHPLHRYRDSVPEPRAMSDRTGLPSLKPMIQGPAASAPAAQTISGRKKGEVPAPGLPRVVPVNDRVRPAAVRKIDTKTKPLGALGRLEDLAVQMSLIQESLTPRIERRAMLVFAADHGITEEGVSAYPSEVTRQMVENFLNGGAAINVLCRFHDIDLTIVDMGVNADFSPHPLLCNRKVRKGTRNFALEAAMTREELSQALLSGAAVFEDLYREKSVDIVGFGEMGIGNTTSAAAIISCVTGLSPAMATGRGTGVDDTGLARKTEVIEKALAFHKPDPEDGLEILRTIGGFELAGIAGATIAAAARRTAIVLDGVISTAACLAASLICPDISGFLIAGHRSVEPAHQAALDFMGLVPVIDFGLRLGEGTAAALAINTVGAACRIMEEMASFEDAGVSAAMND